MKVELDLVECWNCFHNFGSSVPFFIGLSG